nr:hemicentin-1-like [Procambarus clarkii]
MTHPDASTRVAGLADGSPAFHTPALLPALLRLLLLLQSSLLVVHAFGDYQEAEGDTTVVEAVAGYDASLPCTIHSPPNDSPILTLWYIGDDQTPVYSYDQRLRVSGESWADSQVFQGRAHYLAHLNPPAMLIMRTSVDDAHVYRCRVDFNNSNSRVASVRLKVIVPPERVEIISQFSPVFPGDKNDVVCRAIGGSPAASVVWRQGGRVVDANSTVEHGGAFNMLEVPASRTDLSLPFTCHATNNDVTAPVTANYTRNVTCGPASVRIEASENPLVEGREAEVTCTAEGSNPPARVIWYQQGRTVDADFINVTRQDRETISVLSLVPTRHHHGRQLLCRAENPSLPLATIEDIFTLNVAYRPKAVLEVDWPRRSELMTEGSDLFLVCLVEANPKPYKIKFFHNEEELVPNEDAGVLVKEATLKLEHLTREHSGRYLCVASNVEGDSHSNNLTINIKYSPRCAMTPGVVGVALGEVTNITCHVDADPDNVTFMWTFNNAAKRVRSRVIDSKLHSASGLTSVLRYSPASVRDYGVLSCYASNNLGTQREPCTFTLVTAGPPEKVNNCSVFNVTSHSAQVFCSSGVNSGLTPHFLHQIRVASSGELVFNRTSQHPYFNVTSLRQDETYVITVVAFNTRGKSFPQRLHLHTLRELETHLSLPSRPEPQPLMWVMGVVGGVVVAVMGVVVGVWWARGRRDSHTLRNREEGLLKLNKPDVTGGGTGGDGTDGLCVNGMVQHTIYDSTGRYRGFAHLQPNEMYQSSCMMAPTATPAAPAVKPEATVTHSRFSLSRKGRPSAAPSAVDASTNGDKETMNGNRGVTRGSEIGEGGSREAGNTEVDGAEEGSKKREAPWRKVISQLTSPHDSKFFEVWKVAASRQSRQSTPSESIL